MMPDRQKPSLLWGFGIVILCAAVVGLAILATRTWAAILFSHSSAAQPIPTAVENAYPTSTPTAFPTASAMPIQTTQATSTRLPPPITATSTIPAVTAQNWQILSQVNFRSPADLSDEWSALNAVRFETYQLLVSGLFTFQETVRVSFASPAGGQQEMKIGLAFSETPAASVALSCNDQNEMSYPMLTLTANTWTLESVQNQTRALLLQGSMNPALSDGDWSWVRLRCARDTVSAWQDDNLLFQQPFDFPAPGDTVVQFSPGFVRLYSFQALILPDQPILLPLE